MPDLFATQEPILFRDIVAGLVPSAAVGETLPEYYQRLADKYHISPEMIRAHLEAGH